MPVDKKSVGSLIREARKGKKITAAELGRMLEPNVSHTAVCKWETGETEPSITHMVQIGDILDIRFASFFEKDSEPSRIEYYFSKMTDDQKDAVINVARAMVE